MYMSGNFFISRKKQSNKFTERIFLIMGDSTRPVVESDAWCRTTSGDKASTTFTWTIEDFFDRPEKNREFMSSSPFTVSGPNDKKTTWNLKLYPRGDVDGDGDLVSLYLENTVQESREKHFFQTSVLNDKHQKDHTVDFSMHDVNELYCYCYCYLLSL